MEINMTHGAEHGIDFAMAICIEFYSRTENSSIYPNARIFTYLWLFSSKHNLWVLEILINFQLDIKHHIIMTEITPLTRRELRNENYKHSLIWVRSVKGVQSEWTKRIDLQFRCTSFRDCFTVKQWQLTSTPVLSRKCFTKQRISPIILFIWRTRTSYKI